MNAVVSKLNTKPLKERVSQEEWEQARATGLPATRLGRGAPA